MTTIIPIPAFGDNYGCGREYTPANLRFARAVEAADVLLSGAPGRPYVLRRNGVRARRLPTALRSLTRSGPATTRFNGRTGGWLAGPPA